MLYSSEHDAFASCRFTALRRAFGAHGQMEATRISAWLAHGFVTEAEVFRIWHERLGLTLRDPLCERLALRMYRRHVRRHLGDAIFNDLRTRNPAIGYAVQLPVDIRMAATGIRAIDTSVSRLYDTGHLPHQQRIWLASYIIHLRKVDWRAGADWMYGHLLDGDAATNHLSWQTIAGTTGETNVPQVFHNDQILRVAPTLTSPGTGIDAPLVELEGLASRDETVVAEGIRPLPVREPALLGRPTWRSDGDLMARVRGRSVVLVHPWMIATQPVGTARDAVRIGIVHLPAHVERPWNERRWDFVHDGMRRYCDAVWMGDLRQVPTWLKASSECCSLRPDDKDYAEAMIATGMRMIDVQVPWPEPDLPCANFSAYLRTIVQRTPGLTQSGIRGQIRRLRRDVPDETGYSS